VADVVIARLRTLRAALWRETASNEGDTMLVEAIGTLIFIATVLAMLGGVIYSIYFLFAHRPTRARNGLAGTIVWLVVYVAAMIAASLLTPQTVLNQGQERCFDEMCFSATQVSTARTLGTGDGAQSAQGIYYVVTVQLRNASVRTPQRPDSPSFALADSGGRTYTPSAAGQQAIGQDPAWNTKLQPGEVAPREVVFDAPASLQDVYLLVAEGGWPSAWIIGDENSLFHKKTAIRLAL
jgi:hypothetical protein